MKQQVKGQNSNVDFVDFKDFLNIVIDVHTQDGHLENAHLKK